MNYNRDFVKLSLNLSNELFDKLFDKCLKEAKFVNYVNLFVKQTKELCLTLIVKCFKRLCGMSNLSNLFLLKVYEYKYSTYYKPLHARA